MPKKQSQPTTTNPDSPDDPNIVRVHGGGGSSSPSAPPPGLPPGTIDVTDQFFGSGGGGGGNPLGTGGGAPPPGLADAMMLENRTLATPRSVNGRAGREAENTQFLKHLTEEEQKRGLVKRHVAITPLTDWQIHEIVNSQSHGYNGSVSEFMRHAIEMLIMYYVETGQFPPANIGFATDIMRQQHSLRLDMEREKLRLELITAIKVFDKGMDMARRTNDMAYIAKKLRDYKDMLDNCPSEAQRQQVRGVLLDSLATRAAVQVFHKWTHERYRFNVGEWDDSWVDLSDQWADWYSDELSQ